jgi:hypothetical protein
MEQQIVTLALVGHEIGLTTIFNRRKVHQYHNSFQIEENSFSRLEPNLSLTYNFSDLRD